MTRRLWTENLPPLDLPAGRQGLPKLEADLEVDTLIVGAGITGLMTAYMLAKAGKAPVVIEKDEHVASGETGSTTAFLTAMPDAGLAELQKTFGDKDARTAVMSGQSAIGIIEEIVRAEGIACEFMRVPAHIFAASPDDVSDLKKEAALAAAYGLDASFREEGLPFEHDGHLEIAAQAKFHPGMFLRELAARAVAAGARIYVDTAAVSCGSRHVVTARGRITARRIILATHAPLGKGAESVRISARMTYVVAARIPKGAIPEGLYWDTAKPYRYFRVDALEGHDRLMFGGFDHSAGKAIDTQEAFGKLEAALPSLLSGTRPEITHRWSGQVLKSDDGLPYIGNQLFGSHQIATGYDGNGMTFGVVAAKILSDRVLGKKNAWTRLYSPLRLKHPIKSLVQMYHIIRGKVADMKTPKESGKLDLKPGEGRVIVRDGKRLAVSCGQDGRCQAVSATCTHLGCTVGWNSAEKTWDCPCHGSRFKSTGEVMNGPAITPLKRLPMSEKE